MERGKRKMATTTTTTTRRTLNAAPMPDSVQHTRLKMGRPKSVRGSSSAVNGKSKNDNPGSEDAALMNDSSSSDCADVSCSDQRSVQHTSSSRMKIASNGPSDVSYSPRVQVFKKSRSEPMKVDLSSGIELRKARSENWDERINRVAADSAQKNDQFSEVNDGCGLDQQEQSDGRQDDSMRNRDLGDDSDEGEEVSEEIEEDESEKVSGCETEVVVAESPKENVVIDESSDHHVDHAIAGENEETGELHKIENVDAAVEEKKSDDGYGGVGGGGGDGGDAGGDELTQLNNSDNDKIVEDDVIDAKTNDDGIDGDGGGGGDGLTQLKKNKFLDDDNGGGSDVPNQISTPKKNRIKRVISPNNSKFNSSLPKSTPTSSLPLTSPTKPATSSSVPSSAEPLNSARYKPTASRSSHKSNLKSPIPTTTEGEPSNENDTFRAPETHSKLQTLVDLVMWKDISRSAFIFGSGTFVIISSSYAKDFEFSLISVVAYMSLVYLAIVFLYKSFMRRGVMDKEEWPEMHMWGEEEALWLVRLILPYLNELLLKLRGIFSGDPAMTMKLAVALFVLARCGSSITLWKMIKLAFFGVFTVPKLCSSYSSHISAYGNFWVGRFRDVWESCSHKKALAFAIFTLVWNFSSVIARIWAAFMLFVAFRYYQQSLITHDFSEEQPVSSHSHNVHLRHLARNRSRVPTSLDQRKQKKSL